MSGQTRAEIRETTACPVCNAARGQPCTGTKKGRNHLERMQLAQKMRGKGWTRSAWEPIDEQDHPDTWDWMAIVKKTEANFARLNRNTS